MLLDTANATNSIQNCPKLPKIAKICQHLPENNFEILPKIEILVLLKNKNLYM
jgi:hypothetical protein